MWPPLLPISFRSEGAWDWGKAAERRKWWELKGRNESYRKGGRKNLPMMIGNKGWLLCCLQLLLRPITKRLLWVTLLLFTKLDFNYHLTFKLLGLITGSQIWFTCWFWPWILPNSVYIPRAVNLQVEIWILHISASQPTNISETYRPNIFRIPFQAARGKNFPFWSGKGHGAGTEEGKGILGRDSRQAWTRLLECVKPNWAISKIHWFHSAATWCYQQIPLLF